MTIISIYLSILQFVFQSTEGYNEIQINILDKHQLFYILITVNPPNEDTYYLFMSQWKLQSSAISNKKRIFLH